MSQITMAELSAKMKEYVKMDEELEFAAFSAYYQDVMSFLQASYQEMSQEELIQAESICGIISGNSKTRAAKKDANRKKFQKMGEKSEFWQNAIKARLKKEGLGEAELQEKAATLWDEPEQQDEQE